MFTEQRVIHKQQVLRKIRMEKKIQQTNQHVLKKEMLHVYEHLQHYRKFSTKYLEKVWELECHLRSLLTLEKEQE